MTEGIKRIFTSASAAYNDKKSITAVGRFLVLYLIRRIPQAVRRRVETRRSISQINDRAPLTAGLINIAVLIGGAIGDNIVAARFLRDIQTASPNIVFDVYTANVVIGKWVYESVLGVRNCFQDRAFESTRDTYPAALTLFGGGFSMTTPPQRSGDEPQKLPSEIDSIRIAWKRRQPTHRDGTPVSDRDFAYEMVFRHNQTRSTAAHFVAGVPYGGDRFSLRLDRRVLDNYQLSHVKYVTVHNGFDVIQVAETGGSTKVYPHFGNTIKIIRQERDDIVFVQVGSKTSVAIDGIDVNLIGRTSLPEVAAILADAVCHIDNESGLVHIASCVGTPCVVVYGPTNPDYFSYAGNVGVRPLKCGGCWQITRDWITRCPRCLSVPVCLAEQPPSAVAGAALKLLNASLECSAQEEL